jgi:hypothetical protein
MIGIALLTLLLIAVMVRVELSQNRDESRVAIGIRWTSVLLSIDTCPDLMSSSGTATRYALYDWKFRLRFEAVWTIHGVVVTVCQ